MDRRLGVFHGTRICHSPFREKEDQADDTSELEIDFDAIHKALIEPALTAVGLGGGTTVDILEAGNIREDMFNLILEGDVVVCDITIHNANVFYELGIRHALRKKHTVLLKGGPVADEIPFDNLTDRYLAYEIDDPAKAVKGLTRTLEATLASDRTDNPIFTLLPTLREVDPETVVVLPQDLAEEIERAKSAKAFGWLRLLSEEVESRRFQWLALRSIGRAQWHIKDPDGAKATYKKLIARERDDLAANDALANLYERQFRAEKVPELLTQSDQAIDRVLANKHATLDQRTEAFSQKGRNAKTRWRQTFDSLEETAQRRQKAVNRQLLQAYDGYLKAFSNNLNHHWSGLAALQMCAIAVDLSAQDAWEYAFNTEQDARDKKAELARAFDSLKGAVKMAVQQAQANMLPGTNERAWADISNADWLFLTEPQNGRIKQAYIDSVPSPPWFLEAVRGQLELFAKLGIKEDLANEIIADLSTAADDPRPPPSIAIVAGHRTDEPGRSPPRFPEGIAEAVRNHLREKLTELKRSQTDIRVLASGAPGTDILCHELCHELGVKSTICLPMPVDAYARQTFRNQDAWRSRFLALVAKTPSLKLNDAPGLPNWLRATDTDPWMRGNRWVLQLALSSGAPNVSLIAVIDESQSADGPGGTDHMICIAEDKGTVDVDKVRLKDGAVI